MAILDLSSAFDIVNAALLLKKLCKIGVLEAVVQLIEV
jgi:hypothetical protein